MQLNKFPEITNYQNPTDRVRFSLEEKKKSFEIFLLSIMNAFATPVDQKKRAVRLYAKKLGIERYVDHIFEDDRHKTKMAA